jgi:CRP/FNR family transcriptional regulator, polysaccharide utilization system transcription regulator
MKTQSTACENCLCRKFSIFNHCAVNELEHLTTVKNTNLYKKGQVIFHEGNKPYGVYCVSSGKVKISKSNSEGKEQIIRLAKTGDVLGYRALMADTTYSASAVVLEDAVVCFIPKEEFNNLIDHNAKVGHELLKLISTVLGTAEERMAKMALKPVRERLAEALLLLYRTYQTTEDEKEFSIAISREDLASLVGTAKETAIRFLSEFKEDNIISTQGSIIKIIDLNKLIKISQLYD